MCVVLCNQTPLASQCSVVRLLCWMLILPWLMSLAAATMHEDEDPQPSVAPNRNPSYDDTLRTGLTGLEYATYLSQDIDRALSGTVESVVVRRYIPNSKTYAAETVFPSRGLLAELDTNHDFPERTNADTTTTLAPVAMADPTSLMQSVQSGKEDVTRRSGEDPVVSNEESVHLGEGAGVGRANHTELLTLFRVFETVDAELDFYRRRRHRGDGGEHGQGHPSSDSPTLAYLIIISNEDFVDGALVLGRSLRMNSPFLRESKADMCLIVPRGRISPVSQVRLFRDGLFDHVIEVNPLAEMAPKAFWKDTFDKIYMFNLTQYDKVVFMDADMVCVRRDMDELFQDQFAKIAADGSNVAAIGDKHGFGAAKGAYFQTGMMVIRPKSNVFNGIYKLFIDNVPPNGNLYNRGMHGRDGVLLRDYFKDNFQPLDNKYSRNLNPRWRIPQGVISLHLRGKHKPWFNKMLPNEDPELGKKEFGFPYIEWWRIYEDLIHTQSEAYVAALYFEMFPDKDATTNTTPPKTVDELLERHGVSSLAVGSSPPVKALTKADDLSEAYRSGPHIATRAALLETLHTLHENSALVSDALKARWKKVLQSFGSDASESNDNVDGEVNGAESNRESISPLTHVWMMRGNPKKAYTQHLLAVDRHRRLSVEGLHASGAPKEHPKSKDAVDDARNRNVFLIAGKPGSSCDSVCAEPSAHASKESGVEHHELPQRAMPFRPIASDAHDPVMDTLAKDEDLPSHLTCSPHHLRYGMLQNCTLLKRMLGCGRCEAGIYWRPHPGSDYPSRLNPDLLKEAPTKKPSTRGGSRADSNLPQTEICYFNFLHDERSIPNCTASFVGVARLCTCVAA